MESLATNPAFRSYVVMSVVLALNLIGLWLYSGAVRSKTPTAMNEEDGVLFKKAVEPHDPPEVARVLRAFANAQANIYPFLLLSFLYVILGGHAPVTEILFAVFTFARLAHSIVYVTGKQPWRTVSFVVGLVATFALMGLLIKAVV